MLSLLRSSCRSGFGRAPRTTFTSCRRGRWKNSSRIFRASNGGTCPLRPIHHDRGRRLGIPSSRQSDIVCSQRERLCRPLRNGDVGGYRIPAYCTGRAAQQCRDQRPALHLSGEQVLAKLLSCVQFLSPPRPLQSSTQSEASRFSVESQMSIIDISRTGIGFGAHSRSITKTEQTGCVNFRCVETLQNSGPGVPNFA